MIGAVAQLCIAVFSTLAVEDRSNAVPPKVLDQRLVLERIAAEPEIVTPTGIAVDGRGRVLVIESHTHFRPSNYSGPPADRIRVFEDRDRDGRTECTGTFFEGTRMTMNLRVAGDASVFVATRSALYRLWDRDGDGKADGIEPGFIAGARSSAWTRRATIRTTGSRGSRSIMRVTSTSGWVKTWEPTFDSWEATE